MASLVIRSYKISFRPGFWLEPYWGILQHYPDTLVSWRGGYEFPSHSTPLLFCVRNIWSRLSVPLASINHVANGHSTFHSMPPPLKDVGLPYVSSVIITHSFLSVMDLSY